MRRINKILLGIILGIVFLIFLYGLINYIKFNTCKKGTKKSGDFCIYKNIPENIGYSYPPLGGNYLDDLPAEVRIRYGEDLEEFFVRTNENKYLGEIFSFQSSNWACIDSGDSPEKINLFYYNCGRSFFESLFPTFAPVGCGYSRFALVCGDSYIISDFSSTAGPRFFGPFER